MTFIGKVRLTLVEDHLFCVHCFVGAEHLCLDDSIVSLNVN